MKDTKLCIKFTILERCLHYLMITPRTTNTKTDKNYVKFDKVNVLVLKVLILDNILNPDIRFERHVCPLVVQIYNIQKSFAAQLLSVLLHRVLYCILACHNIEFKVK